MIQGALFDFDGTLINTNHLIFESYRHTYQTLFEQEITDDYILAYYGRPLLAAFRDRHGEEMAQNMLRVYREYNARHHDGLAQTFEGVTEGLSELKKMGIKTAIVTSKLRPMVLRGIEMLGIGECLDVVITPEDTTLHKPEPEPALTAAKRIGVAPQNCVMVGDAIFDIQCGKAAGMMTVGMSYSLTPIDELKKYKPDVVLDSISQLPEWIRGVNHSK